MPLFVCDQCHGIDNTACGGNYWDRLITGGDKKTSRLVLCCECYTGTWHGQFTKRIFDPTKDRMFDFEYIPARLRTFDLKYMKTVREVKLPDNSTFKCQPTGRKCRVMDIPDGGLFESDGNIWEKLPGSCANLSDLNDDSEVIAFIIVDEWREVK